MRATPLQEHVWRKREGLQWIAPREHGTKKPTGERRFLCIGCRAGLSGLVQPATCWIGDPNVDEDRAAELTGGVRRAPNPGQRDAFDRAARSHEGNPSLDRVSRAYSYSGQPALTRSGRFAPVGIDPNRVPYRPAGHTYRGPYEPGARSTPRHQGGTFVSHLGGILGGTPCRRRGPRRARDRCARDSYPTCEPLSRSVFLVWRS